MAIIVNIDVMLAKRKMQSGELADKIGITAANLSILKTGKAEAVRFSTLESICKALAENDEEMDYLMGELMPPMLVGGFTTVTIASVFIAGIFANFF